MKKLTIRCPLNSLLGYGAFSYEVCRQMRHLTDCSIFPIGGNNIFPSNSKDVDWIAPTIQNRFNSFDNDSACLTIWHEHALSEFFMGGGPRVGLPFFEINSVADPTRKFNLEYCDLILQTSHWGAEVIRNSSIKTQVKVIDMGVDTNVFAPTGIRKSSPYKIYSVGKIEKRKQSYELISYFNKAFGKNDDVELHLHVISVLQDTQIQFNDYVKFAKESKLADKINIIQQPFESNIDLATWINTMDLGVFPSKGEGGAMCVLECLACGKPCIATDYSAIRSVVDPTSAHLIKIDAMEKAYAPPFFDGSCEWAEYGDKQVDQFISLMQSCYKNRVNQNHEGVEFARKRTWAKTAQQIIDSI